MHHTSHKIITFTLLIAMQWACSTDADEPTSPEEQQEDMASMADLTPTADMNMEVEEDMQPDLGGSEEDADMGGDMAAELEFIELAEKPWDVRERGPYNVGYGTGTVTFNVKPSDEPRTLDVVFWYPTLQKTGKDARYMRGLVGIGSAFDGAIIADSEETFPMMVFSHGNGSIAEQSFTYTEHFASHGWIIVAPYHTLNSFFDNPSSINYLSSVDRPQDISAVLDWTEDLPEEHILHGHIDYDKILMSGHSFGAFTTMAVSGAQFDVEAIETYCETGEINQGLCELFGEENKELFRAGFTEPRLKAAIPHTPGIGLVFEDGVNKIQIPLLMMTAGRDKALPAETNGDYMWNRMTEGPHARFDLPNGGHFTYSNMCNLLGTFEQASEDGCDETFIPADIALPMINHYSLAWAEYHILGDMRHEALITGEDRPYDSETLIYETIDNRRVTP